MNAELQEPEELIESEAMTEEGRILKKWGDELYCRAQTIASESGSRKRGAVLITREHFIQAQRAIEASRASSCTIEDYDRRIAELKAGLPPSLRAMIELRERA